MKKLLFIALAAVGPIVIAVGFVFAMGGFSKYVMLPEATSIENIHLTGHGMGDDLFLTCLDRVWPEKDLNEEMKNRYFANSGRISKLCRQFGESPDYKDYVVCCEAGK